MKKRILLVGSVSLVAAVVTIAAIVPGSAQGPQPQMAGYEAPVDVDTAGLPGPRQPIFYRHDVHAGQYQIDCRYCHFAVERSTSAGLPTLSTCMGCHRIAGIQNPEVQKLQQAVASGEGVEWVEVHVLAPFVRFPHMRHVNTDKGELGGKPLTEKCETCHGPIREMVQVYQFASLKMGWCVDCHRKSEARTDCTVCHY